jgi:hypothetical protein
MAATTKAELVRTLALISEEVQTLRVLCAEQAQTIKVLEAMDALHAAKAAHLRPSKSTFVRTAPVVTPEQLEFRARCAAARDEAVRSGRSVLV